MVQYRKEQITWSSIILDRVVVVTGSLDLRVRRENPVLLVRKVLQAKKEKKETLEFQVLLVLA